LSSGIVIAQSRAVSATITAPFKAPGRGESSRGCQCSQIAPAITSRMPKTSEGAGISPRIGIASRVAKTGVSDSKGTLTESGATRIPVRNRRLATRLRSTEPRAGSQ
jgi:hypothetical protein